MFWEGHIKSVRPLNIQGQIQEFFKCPLQAKEVTKIQKSLGAPLLARRFFLHSEVIFTHKYLVIYG